MNKKIALTLTIILVLVVIAVVALFKIGSSIVEKNQNLEKLGGFWKLYQVMQEYTDDTGQVISNTKNITAKELFGEDQIIEFTSQDKICLYYLLNEIYTTQGNKCTDYTYKKGKISALGFGYSKFSFNEDKLEIVEEDVYLGKTTYKFEKVARPGNIINS